MQFLIGADPEYFVKKNGVFVSAHGLVAGDKKNPLKIKNGAVQVDGMALEFNIDPAASKDQFYTNITSVMDQLRAMVPDYEHVFAPVADFDPDHLKAQPEVARELGCDPDYNAWTNDVNPKPDGDRPMRTASGHIHIGWTKDMEQDDIFHRQDCIRAAKAMDVFLGLPSVILDPDTRRREMYGKAGCFRVKSYGVEYRTLSNFWLQSKGLIDWAYDSTMTAMDKLVSGYIEPDGFYQDVRKAIDNGDKSLAREWMRYFGVSNVPKVTAHA